MLFAEVLLIIAILFLAGKDASSYLLKDKTSDNQELTLKRIKRWHRDGVILYILYTIPLLFLVNPFLILTYALLIRLAIFDIAFNYWSGLDPKFLGSTSKVDQFFVKLLGQDGAIKKSAIFLIILLLLNLIFI